MATVNFKCKVTEDQYEMDLPVTMLIAEAKRDLEIKVPLLASHDQKWIFQGRVLKDTDTLEQSGIREGLCVHVMKTAKATTPANSSLSTPPSAAASAAASAAPTYVPVPAFDEGMHMLLGNEETKAKDAIILLLKIISNIIDKPMEEKYRKVKATSKAFTKLDIAGGKECILAMGFNLVGEEYVLTPSAQAWEVLISCQAKLDRFMAKYIEVQDEQPSSASGSGEERALPTSQQASGGGGPASTSSVTQSDGGAMAAAMQLMLSAMINNTASQQGGGTGTGTDSQEGSKVPANPDSSSSSSCNEGDGDGSSKIE